MTVGEMGPQTIYVALRGEGTDVWRPAKANQVSPNVFLITGSRFDGEVWEFDPGSVVRVESRIFNSGSTCLVALSLAENPNLTALENAVLRAISLRVSKDAGAYVEQWLNAVVSARQNTGAGCFINLRVEKGSQLSEIDSPVGHIHATVSGLSRGLGFMLWLRDGWLDQLEGFSYEESTEDINLEQASFDNVREIEQA